jgi:hypothetical protein
MSGVMRAAVRALGSSNKFISPRQRLLDGYQFLYIRSSTAPEPSLALSSSSILDIIYDWVKIYSPAPHNYLIK